MIVTSIALLAGAMLVSAAPAKRSTNGPYIMSDFPDPSVIKVNGTWYAFASNSVYDNKNINVQVASSPDFASWSLHDGADALPSIPSWVNATDPLVWAPDVNQLDDGTFVLYFSATTNTAGDGTLHCIGTATSTSVTGPYTAGPTPWTCPTSQGGAIDASGFRDYDGTWSVVYKIDGNSLGNGGICNNDVEPIADTPIMIQPVATDGITPSGPATTLLHLQSDEGSDIEAPSLFRQGEGDYYLLYSSHCYSTSDYDVRYATSSSITGPFTRQGVLLGDGQGGADADFDAVDVVFHGLQADGRRFFYTGSMVVEGDSVSI